MILELMLVFLWSFCISSEDSTHLCVDRTSGKSHCCSDFEEKNGKCVACEAVGFTSDVGQPCRKCSGMFYGSRCLDACHCQFYEECHHIYGCIGDKQVPESTVSNSISGTSVTTTLSVHTVSYLVPTEKSSDWSESVTVYGNTISVSTESTRHNVLSDSAI
ncbi:uncharacterized protein LOC143061970 [Mytilus galloprovincialis]|uniref:uncharacterized protein LOC143061970 n=1 Tax=Mytilus galloprovincialis TaxID=29158 RepID=UPI003F7B5558